MLTEISRIQEIKSGFMQGAYRNDKLEILLSTIKAHTGLDNHKHDHKQFGYCFSGSFRLLHNERISLLSKDSYYLLNGSIEHSAEALEDFYALDFKYLEKDEIIQGSFHDNLFICNCNYEKLNAGSHFICKFTSKKDNDIIEVLFSEYNLYLVVPENQSLYINSEQYFVETMNVYKVSIENNLKIYLENEGNCIFLIFEKREVNY